jgi:PAS domain S-box-containing protein
MLQNLINDAAYMAHGYCLLWKPWLITLHATSDVFIFGAYFAIPSAIWIFLRKRTDLSAELRPLAVLFAGFIFLCGLTHAVQLATLWWPIYETQGFVKAATALVSVTTAITIFPLIQNALAIPSPRQLQLANDELAKEIAAHRETLAALGKAKDELEMRVAERTRELEQSKARFEALVKASAQTVWTCNAEGQVEEDSPSWRAFTGRSYEEMKGEGWLEDIHPDHRANVAAAWQEALRTLQPYSKEVQLRHTSGWRWTAAKAVPLLNENGGVREWVGMNVDIDERKRSEAALRTSEERFRGIFENAGTGIAIADLEGRFRSCNPAYSTMLGYSQQELFELTCLALMHPDDREANLAEKRRLLGKEILSFEIVNRYIGKGGKLIWVQKHVSLLRDAAGNPTNTVVLATDVTERKRQEDHIRLLMREVNHRSKNVLTVVQAIARQTAAANPNDFAARFSDRVHALAASQDVLVRNEWKGANLDELVRSQLAHFEDLIGTRIRLQGPPVIVTASAAQALGMTLHELATNAGKYGALANGDGRVAIEWGLEENNAGGRTFTICWREQGNCPVAPPSKRGFGSTVICEMAELSLEAKVDLAFLASGLNWQLQCSAGHILQESHPIAITENEKPARSSPASSGRPRILVVEDEAVVAIEIAQVLVKAGFDVVGPARTANQALQLVNEIGCDAAVLDVNLGSETSERVALRLIERGTPFITLSGYSKEQHPLLFNGARSLAKPLQPEFLIAELEACMAHRSAASQASASLSVHELSAVS